ncbi:MAG: NAD+ synthase [candidate division WOR-3 bacterium]
MALRIGLAQVNPTVGDFAGNLELIEQALERLRSDRPDMVVFPELCLTGYPPRDLLEREWFVRQAEEAAGRLRELSARYPGTGILCGTIARTGRSSGRPLHNCAVLVESGGELFRQAKTLLPTYDVFDEARYFEPAAALRVFDYRGERLGITICEDAWNLPGFDAGRRYERDPVAELAGQGATVFLNIAASPFAQGKEATRFGLLAGHARRHGRPMAFVNQVGGNDELVFDGRSLAVDGQGRLTALLAMFEEQVAVVDTAASGAVAGYQPMERVESVYRALVLGVRDYVRKCGFEKVVLGLSGGIDSAVTCCIAAAAVGPENVMGVTMPSEFSSEGSVTDSRELAANLGVEFRVIPIHRAHQSYLEMLADTFAGLKPDTTEENIQARVRGNVLMAISNKFGCLVLNTGNKSELAVGYCTLYGDMSGGLSVLADVPKTLVYELAMFVNGERAVIPEMTMTKPPSAELRPNQTDQDTLPPYPVLDRIIERYVDEGASPEEIAAEGIERRIVDWVVRAVDRNEYKRRQAAPGIKVSGKAFGIGRRFPVAARYRH